MKSHLNIFIRLFPLAEIFILALLFSFYCNWYISYSTQSRIYETVNEIPENEVGLVLGASKYLGVNKKYINYYFKNRMEKAAELYHAGKVHHLLVSGDNHSSDYDEPTDMKNYLMDLGVPETAITLDYAGFRTFDSIIRAKMIFGLNSFTIVSQEFHNERALFICDQLGIDAIAINAEDVYRGPNSLLREYLAKTKAVVDLMVGVKPKFLGPREIIEKKCK